MVGTAQADNFAVFIKKVGYSVGVEALLARAIDFGERYASVASFSDSDWTSLVQEKWNLRTANVGDVFAALHIARIHNREVIPGPIGEALGITRKLLSDSEFKRASEFLLALAIVDSDGDVFLNALHSKFDPEVTANSLMSMVREKRNSLYNIFKSARDREAIAVSVSIERQRSNRGGASMGGLSEAARGSPINERVQGFGLPKPMDLNTIEPPSKDYLHKITVSRKGWAESLGLFYKGDLTDRGVAFLSTLSASRFSSKDATFCVWPTAFEIERNQFDVKGLEALNPTSSWGFQTSVFRAMDGKLESEKPVEIDAIQEVARGISETFRVYRTLSQNRSMIRNEIANYVVIAVCLARAYATESFAPNIAAVLLSPLLSKYGVVVRKSKTIELAITIRANANQST